MHTPGHRPPLRQARAAEVAHAVVADYDHVRTWSDPSARQCELARIGATAVDLLRRLGGELDYRGCDDEDDFPDQLRRWS